MICHSVVFKLKYPKNSKEEVKFLNAAKDLSSIPGVNNFRCLRQISKKNNFDYGIFMEFDTQEDYERFRTAVNASVLLEHQTYKFGNTSGFFNSLNLHYTIPGDF